MLPARARQARIRRTRSRAARRARESFWDPPRGPARACSTSGPSAASTRSCRDGLGGGSLIYANVLLRKDEDWFVAGGPAARTDGYEYWPVTRADLDPHYDRVERMIERRSSSRSTTQPYDSTPQDASRSATPRRSSGSSWRLVSLAVTFANEGDRRSLGEPIRGGAPNLHGRTRLTCQLVRRVRRRLQLRREEHARLHYLTARAARRRRHPHAPRGALASSRARAAATARTSSTTRAREGGDARRRRRRSHAHVRPPDPVGRARSARPTCCCATAPRCPGFSPKLGTRFCGNGDLLTFVLNTKQDGAGRQRERRGSSTPARPGDHEHRAASPTREDGGDGPRLLPRGRRLPAVRVLDPARARRARQLWRWRDGAAHLVKNWLKGSPDTDVTAQIADLMLPTRAVRGRPAAAGHGPRRPRRPDVPARTAGCDLDWNKHGARRTYFERVRDRLARHGAASSAGASSTTRSGSCSRVITVHPLGGAPMGRDRDEGVVDSLRPRLRPPRPAHRRRLGHARPDRPEPELHDRRAGRPLRRPHPRP